MDLIVYQLKNEHGKRVVKQEDDVNGNALPPQLIYYADLSADDKATFDAFEAIIQNA